MSSTTDVLPGVEENFGSSDVSKVPCSPPPSYHELESVTSASVPSELPEAEDETRKIVILIPRGAIIFYSGCRSVFGGLAWFFSFVVAVAQTSMLYYQLHYSQQAYDQVRTLYNAQIVYYPLKEHITTQFIMSCILPFVCVAFMVKIRRGKRSVERLRHKTQFLLQCLLLSLHLLSGVASATFLRNVSGASATTRNYVTPVNILIMALSTIAALVQVTAIYSGYNVSSRIDEHDCGRRAIVIQASLVIHVFSFATTLVGSFGCSMSTILIIMALNVVGSAALLALHACRDVVRRIETIEFTVVTVTLITTMLASVLLFLPPQMECEGPRNVPVALMWLSLVCSNAWALRHFWLLMRASEVN